MSIGHLEGLRTKTSKDVQEVGSKGCKCDLYFLLTLRSKKCMIMCGKVDNGCFSCFMIETLGYDSQRPTNGL